MALVEVFAAFSVLSIILFIAGIILIILEMFEPGFGIFGILGVISLIANIFVTAETVSQGIVLTVITFMILLVLFVIFLVLMSKGRLPGKMILRDAETGFSGTEDLQYLLGKTGTVTSKCRPVGSAEIEGIKYDVVSHGEFIDKDKEIEVIQVEGNRVVVREKTS